MSIFSQIHKLSSLVKDQEKKSLIQEFLRDMYYHSLASEQYGVETVSIDSIVNFNNVDISLRNFGTANGNVTHLELLYICSIIKEKLKLGENFLEIGTFDGNTIMNVSLNAPQGSMCYTIDLPLEPATSSLAHHSKGDRELIASPNRKELKHIGIENIQAIYADSMEFDFSKITFSSVFIDGGHHYAAVKSDTENIIKNIKRPGFVMWHDYFGYNEVAQLIHEISFKYKIKRIEATNICFLEIN